MRIPKAEKHFLGAVCKKLCRAAGRTLNNYKNKQTRIKRLYRSLEQNKVAIQGFGGGKWRDPYSYSPSHQITVCGGSSIYIGFKSVLTDA